jgi:CRP-like cAMP-binding protein
MTELARIEVVLFLREVELFQYCDAEEILRIASIAQECRFATGETIFNANEPSDALYAVVEGRVRRDYLDNRTLTVGPRGSFGVLGILSGRLRSAGATAETDTLALSLEAEDFFDLLSNNVEIVKGLFRQLTLGTTEAEEFE